MLGKAATHSILRFSEHQTENKAVLSKRDHKSRTLRRHYVPAHRARAFRQPNRRFDSGGEECQAGIRASRVSPVEKRRQIDPRNLDVVQAEKRAGFRFVSYQSVP